MPFLVGDGYWRRRSITIERKTLSMEDNGGKFVIDLHTKMVSEEIASSLEA